MKNRYHGLDNFKLFATTLVIAIHTGPFEQINPLLNHLLVNGIARVAVPLFFMITGFFTLSGNENQRQKRVRQFIKKTTIIYLISTLIYLPLILYNRTYQFPTDIFIFLKDFFFEGTFYHLWYLPAAILGTLIIHYLLKYFSIKKSAWFTFFLYLFALLGDSYFGLTQQVPLLAFIFQKYFSVFEYTRTGFLFAPVFLMLGLLSQIFSQKNKLNQHATKVGLVASLCLLLLETTLLDHLQWQKHTSMYIMLLPTMFFLYQWLTQIKLKKSYFLKESGLIVYIIHPWMIMLVHLGAKIPLLTPLLTNNLVQFILVTILSFTFAYFTAPLFTKKVKITTKPLRAWREIDENSLINNYHNFEKIVSPKTKIYPVIKADAYGHGALKIATILQQLGAKGFCVATLNEAIALRKGGIKKDILILGYTEPEAMPLVKKYDCIQTIVDQEHLHAILETNIFIRAHLKIDTGMHRIGFSWQQEKAIILAAKEKKLHIEGIFTHFSSADGTTQNDIYFTHQQIKRFDSVIHTLKNHGVTHLLTHAQATYGAINYPHLNYDIARIGGGLFLGLDKKSIISHQHFDLQPIMKIQARISTITHVPKGEGIGYNNAFIAPHDVKIATIAIGYADGLPQQLAQGVGHIQIDKHNVPIIGKICMDQLMVDVTQVNNIKQGDLATIISSKVDNQNSIINFAKQCNIHQNEFASRLGKRI